MPPHETAAPLAVSMGDPAGIGPDITVMAWRARAEKAVPPFVVYGCADVLAARARALSISVTLQTIETPADATALFNSALPVRPIPVAATVEPGKPSSAAAHAVIAAIEDATASVVRGEASALVTNPIAKSVLYQAGFTHPGHTEFLAELASRH